MASRLALGERFLKHISSRFREADRWLARGSVPAQPRRAGLFTRLWGSGDGDSEEMSEGERGSCSWVGFSWANSWSWSLMGKVNGKFGCKMPS